MKKQAPPVHYPRGRQLDAIVENTPVCPTCGGQWGKRVAVKVCRLCGQPLGRTDKYRMVPAGPGLFAIEHKNCEDPTK